MALEVNERSKRNRRALEEQDETVGLNFLSLTGLDATGHGAGKSEVREGGATAVNFNVLQDKVQEIETSVTHFTDLLGAIKSPMGAENMVVEIGSEIFKKEEDVRAWIQSALLSSQAFSVFVDVYVVLEMILLGYTSVQAATMERNQKLSLEADKALIIKTFENKLLTLFSRPMSNGSAVKMVTSTKDSWLPGISNFGALETSNRLGGLKVVIQQQI
eukprot:1230850-Ditylum_brightwellii.AAC.1